MDSQILSQCNQTIYIATQTGIDTQTGEDSWGDPTSYNARVMQKMKMVLDKNGKEVVSSHEIILEGPVDNTVAILVWLPHEDQTIWSQGHNPIATKNQVDENGTHDYSKIWLGGK